MLSLYWNVTRSTAKQVISSWPVALSLVAYASILFVGGVICQPLGALVGGLLMSLIFAACLSSYLELISQAVAGSRFRITLDEFKRTFLVRLWDVVNVMFTFWMIQLVIGLIAQGERGPAILAMVGFAMAFFFNVIPELLYQGDSRSFALLGESARFVTQHPVAWFLPNLVFAALALGASGGLSVQHPVELLLIFGNLFSSPAGILPIFAGLPWWALPLALLALHFVMLFRGLLFRELSSGAGNARMRAFRAKMR